MLSGHDDSADEKKVEEESAAWWGPRRRVGATSIYTGSVSGFSGIWPGDIEGRFDGNGSCGHGRRCGGCGRVLSQAVSRVKATSFLFLRRAFRRARSVALRLVQSTVEADTRNHENVFVARRHYRSRFIHCMR